MLRFSRFTLLFAATWLAACAPPVIPTALPAPDHVAFARGPDGWADIHEPGWFRADFPGLPTSSLIWDQTHQGRYQFKQLVTGGPVALITVRYVEFGNAADIAEARATLGDRLAHPQVSGLHVVSTGPTTLAAGPADEMIARVDPRSATNDAAVPLDERIVMAFRGAKRFYLLQCAAPQGQFAACERFFASVRFE